MMLCFVGTEDHGRKNGADLRAVSTGPAKKGLLTAPCCPRRMIGSNGKWPIEPPTIRLIAFSIMNNCLAGRRRLFPNPFIKNGIA